MCMIWRYYVISSRPSLTNTSWYVGRCTCTITLRYHVRVIMTPLSVRCSGSCPILTLRSCCICPITPIKWCSRTQERRCFLFSTHWLLVHMSSLLDQLLLLLLIITVCKATLTPLMLIMAMYECAQRLFLKNGRRVDWHRSMAQRCTSPPRLVMTHTRWRSSSREKSTCCVIL